MRMVSRAIALLLSLGCPGMDALAALPPAFAPWRSSSAAHVSGLRTKSLRMLPLEDGLHERERGGRRQREKLFIWDQQTWVAGVEEFASNVEELLPNSVSEVIGQTTEVIGQTIGENVDFEMSKERTEVSERRRGLLRRLQTWRGEKFSLWTRCRTECFGTFYIYLLGSTIANLGFGFATAAMAWGFAVGSAVAIGASISGAHYNPAVTVALALGDGFSARDAPAYLLSQYVGALLAGVALAWFFPMCAGIPAATGSIGSEMLVTAFLLYGCLALDDGVVSGRISRAASPILVGSLIFFLNVCYSHLRAGLNPAMLAAPRLVAALSGYGVAISLSGATAYTLGPIIGAIVGGCFFAFGSGRGVGGHGGIYGALGRLGRALSPYYGTHWELIEDTLAERRSPPLQTSPLQSPPRRGAEGGTPQPTRPVEEEGATPLVERLQGGTPQPTRPVEEAWEEEGATPLVERLRGVVVPTTIQPVDARSGAAKMSSDCEEESDGSTAAIETQSTQMARRWTPWMPRLSLEVIARRARTSEECPAETTSRSGPRAAAEAEGAALDIHDVYL